MKIIDVHQPIHRRSCTRSLLPSVLFLGANPRLIFWCC